MYNFKDFISKLDKSRKGYTPTIPFHITKLNRFINGIQKSRYDVIFGDDGVGKTSYVLYTYVYRPFKYMYDNGKTNEFKPIYYAPTLTVKQITLKLISMHLYTKYNLLVSEDILSSTGVYKLSDRILKLIEDEEPFFNSLFSELTIISKMMNPSQLYYHITNILQDRGTYYPETNKYKPDNYNTINVLIFDTVNNLLLEKEQYTTVKSTIEQHSNNCIQYKNVFGCCVVNVSHMIRPTHVKPIDVFPNKRDIKDTTKLKEDSDVVMCLFNPIEHTSSDNTSLLDFMGYNITTLRSRFRALGIVKNNKGKNNIRIGLSFYGECGTCEQLPDTKTITPTDYLTITSKTISIQ